MDFLRECGLSLADFVHILRFKPCALVHLFPGSGTYDEGQVIREFMKTELSVVEGPEKEIMVRCCEATLRALAIAIESKTHT
jgi:hypothetical protein